MTLVADLLSSWRVAAAIADTQATIVQKRTLSYNVETGENGATTNNSTVVAAIVWPPNTQAISGGAQKWAEGVAMETADMLLQVAFDDLPSDLRPEDEVTVGSVEYRIVAVSNYLDAVYEASLRAVR